MYVLYNVNFFFTRGHFETFDNISWERILWEQAIE
jgi:hypothetical protein